jgi:hypothetical protein
LHGVAQNADVFAVTQVQSTLRAYFFDGQRLDRAATLTTPGFAILNSLDGSTILVAYEASRNSVQITVIRRNAEAETTNTFDQSEVDFESRVRAIRDGSE